MAAWLADSCRRRGFAFAGLVATSFPLELPWLPLAAPLGALAIYVLATRPFLRD